MKSDGLVQAEFRSISWLEPYPIEQYKPDPSEPFSIELTVLIGPKGLQGEEIFYVDVSNVLFLEQELRHSGPHAISSTILVDEFSVEAIERILREFCGTCRGRTWHDVALMLMRLGRWEYEGMETP
jgi:hypothetical protein